MWLVICVMPFFFTSEQSKQYKLWSCQKMCDSLYYLLDNIFIRFGSYLYRHIVGIPMGTHCAPLVEDLLLLCYKRDFMLSLSDNNQSDIIKAFNATSRYLDDFLSCLFVMLLCASVYWCLVVTCWKRADLLSLVCDVLLWSCHFSIGILSQMWCLIVLIPDLCPFLFWTNGRSDISHWTLITRILLTLKPRFWTWTCS